MYLKNEIFAKIIEIFGVEATCSKLFYLFVIQLFIYLFLDFLRDLSTNITHTYIYTLRVNCNIMSNSFPKPVLCVEVNNYK